MAPGAVKIEKCLEDYKYLYSKDLFKGKVAVVSGGGSGIGFTISEILMRHGCDVAIVSRSMERLTLASQSLEKATGRICLPLQLDVRDEKKVEEVVGKIMDRFKRIDFLVNSAAGNFVCSAAGLSAKGFKTVLEIDTIGTFLLSQAVYKAYFQGHGGSIVNITANLHRQGAPMQVHVGSAKSAIEAMSNHLAVEWGPDNVRINCIAPGLVLETEGYDRLGGTAFEDAALKQKVQNMIPLQRFSTKTNVAESVIYLLSDASSQVTANIIILDGGEIFTTNMGSQVISNL